jgi:hypothetical protein
MKCEGVSLHIKIGASLIVFSNFDLDVCLLSATQVVVCCNYKIYNNNIKHYHPGHTHKHKFIHGI